MSLISSISSFWRKPYTVNNPQQSENIPQRPRTIDERLQDFFVTGKVGETRRLENYNGKRIIEAYKGPGGYVNKITIKENQSVPYELIRNMIPVPGTKPVKYVDACSTVIVGKRAAFVEFRQMEPGNKEAGLLVRITRYIDDVPDQLAGTYKTFEEFRRDKTMMTMLEEISQKVLTWGTAQRLKKIEKRKEARELVKEARQSAREALAEARKNLRQREAQLTKEYLEKLKKAKLR